MIVGDNGILSEAQSVAKRTEEMQVNSQIYMNELQKELEEKIDGNKERPTLELSLDQTQTGVEKVVITAEAKIIEGSIKEIEKPNGEKQEGDSTTYEVNQNGEYTFKVMSDKGKMTTKTIYVTNIKSEGIDLTGLVTGENPGHEHIYVNSFDDTSHYEECMICGLKRNAVAHSITRKMAIEDAAVCSSSNYYIDTCLLYTSRCV